MPFYVFWNILADEKQPRYTSMGMPSGCIRVMVENEILVKDLRKLDTLKGKKVVKKGTKCWINFENKETTK